MKNYFRAFLIIFLFLGSMDYCSLKAQMMSFDKVFDNDHGYYLSITTYDDGSFIIAGAKRDDLSTIYLQKYDRSFASIGNMVTVTPLSALRDNDYNLKGVIFSNGDYILLYSTQFRTYANLYDSTLNLITADMNLFASLALLFAKPISEDEFGILFQYRNGLLLHIITKTGDIPADANIASFISQMDYYHLHQTLTGGYIVYLTTDNTIFAIPISSTGEKGTYTEIIPSASLVGIARCANGNHYLAYVDQADLNNQKIVKLNSDMVTVIGSTVTTGTNSKLMDISFSCFQDLIYISSSTPDSNYNIKVYDQDFNLKADTTSTQSEFTYILGNYILPTGNLLLGLGTSTYSALARGCLTNYPMSCSVSAPKCGSDYSCTAEDVCSSDSDCRATGYPTCISSSSPSYCSVCSTNSDCSQVLTGSICLPLSSEMMGKCGCTSEASCNADRPICGSNKLCQVCITDAHCSDNESGSLCFNSSAVSKCGCTTDIDCPTPNKPKCNSVDKVCVPRCSLDSECTNNLNGTKCMTSIVPQTCGCSSDSDCADPSKPKCDIANHTCTVACAIDSDCSSDSNGMICLNNLSPVKCGCNSNSNCTNPNLPKCDTSSNRCVAACSSNSECSNDINGASCLLSSIPAKCGCSSDTDCKDPNRLKCSTANNICVRPCETDQECSSDLFGIKCITSLNLRACGCSSDSDCSTESRPRCVTSSHVCQAPCTNDTECSSNSNGALCISSSSSNKCGCTNDNHCTHDSNKPKCDTKTNICIAEEKAIIKSSSAGLTGGEIAGIVIGSVGFVAVVLAGLKFLKGTKMAKVFSEKKQIKSINMEPKVTRIPSTERVEDL